MTTTNDTAAVPQDDARTRVFERIDEILDRADANATPLAVSSEDAATWLPVIFAAVKRFDALTQERVAYVDLLAQADHLIAGVQVFGGDEYDALAPSVIAGAREFEDSSPGFVAMGRILQLQILVDHPEILHLAATRAKDELFKALHHGTLPARLDYTAPVETDTPAE